MQSFVAYATKGCLRLFTCGNAVAANPFPPSRMMSATTPLALFPFPNVHPRQALHSDLGLEDTIPFELASAPG